MGGIYGLVIAIALFFMAGAQIYELNKNAIRRQHLPNTERKPRKIDWRKKLLPVFGYTEWTWLLPLKPDNQKFDPHYLDEQEIDLEDYETLTVVRSNI